MGRKLLRVAEQVLFALNILIVFLFVFENYISLPSWLRVVGRMHPLFLHFPIVLIILAVFLYFFKANTKFIIDKEFLNLLFLFGAITTSITIVMGLFLSSEPEYGGNILYWHKWMAIILGFFISGAYYYLKAGLSASLFKVGCGAIVLVLVMTGHLGAGLTHGEDFLFEPLYPTEIPKQVALDEAKIYDHVIMPIFERKCSTCHSESRAKGKLVLTTREGIRKGGKDGKLFEVDEPGGGLLIQRIHLPLSDKKHMPPKNKQQLTEEEIEILEQWVSEGGELEKRVVELPQNNTLRLTLEQYLTPEEQIYDFESADADIIAKLNSAYRVIYPTSAQSPALEVSIYNPAKYSPAILEDLKPIQKQIVSINLSKMPLKDEDLEIIKHFENLRKLNLNFSTITGSTLQELAILKHLTSLSLSGTNLSDSSVAKIEKLTGLKFLYCWNTGLDNSVWDMLKKKLSGTTIITGFVPDYSKKLKLPAPRILNEKKIYTEPFELELSHPIHGVTIRFTYDGSAPDSLNGMIYEQPLVIDSLITPIRTGAFKEGWFQSEVTDATFYVTNVTPDSIWSNSPYDPKYFSKGAKTLVDHENGNLSFGNYDGWLGYRENAMDISLMFRDPVELRALGLSTRLDYGAHIFPPAEIKLWGGNSKKTMKLIHILHPVQPSGYDEKIHTGINCSFEKQEIRFLRITADPLPILPPWHSNKGEKAWFFVDELLFNSNH